MPEALRTAWGADLKLTAAQTLAALGAPDVYLGVEVRLVGFDGLGNEGLVVEDHELSAQLATLHNQLETVALGPPPRHMAIRPSVDFRVRPTGQQLAQRVAAAITSAVSAETPSTTFTNAPMALIDPGHVAHALEEDYLASPGGGRGAGAYTLYLLNPKVASPYAYAYDKEHRSCPGAIYVSRQFRYAFYDLTANLTFLGPGPGGKGQVLSHSVPALRHYRPEAARRAILPDLAALVWSAVNHLVWPPLAHADVGSPEAVAVHIVYMHQDLMGAVSHINKARLEEELREALSGLQRVSAHEHFHPFGNCPHCVAGYTGALRARTSLPHETDMEVTQYLDLESLEAWVREWRDVVLSDVGVSLPRGGSTKILPVFVFDAAGSDTVLLDGWRQAAALPGGEVVAVRSGQSSVATFFGCHDKQVHIDPQELHRPILASVLTAGWGVSDTALFWSEATGRSWSWLWSVGPTPFGPLSSQTTLSFAQRDAAARNMALAALNSSLGHAAGLVEGFIKVGGPDIHIKSLLMPDQVIPYHQRIALLLYKASEAAVALSRLDHAAALGYASSMAYDAAALHTIVRRTRNTLTVEMECLGSGARARWWLVPGGAAVVCVLLYLWRVLRPLPSEKRHSHLY